MIKLIYLKRIFYPLMLFDNRLRIQPLGAGNEVGRSCIFLQYRDTSILLDCGVHPGFTGSSCLPFLDLVDLSTINAIFITHFHLDHAGALPYLTEKTSFKGKIFMTHPTKAILKWLLNDYIRIINASVDNDFYTEEDLDRCHKRIIAIDYHQEIDIGELRIMGLNAGHVLGAAMFVVRINQSLILYTGDYSREEDRHLKSAESLGTKVDVMICESTYGVQSHLSKEEREERFTSTVHSIVKRGGKCLLPVFALGRAQELLLILEEYWASNKSLQTVPIYYASALASRCMGIYQTYINMMNDRIQRLFALGRNPFIFEFIENLKGMDNFDHTKKCVIMASPGMLQSGLSRELFELWCEDSRNGVIIPGYSVVGTLAKEIMNEPNEIITMNGRRLKLNMSVEYISFSAHVDFVKNREFIKECEPKVLILVHGEFNEMSRLKSALQQLNEQRGVEMKIESPKNGEDIEIELNTRNEGLLIGETEEGITYKGFLYGEGTEHKIIKENELDKLNLDLKLVVIKQELLVPFNARLSLIKEVIFDFLNGVGCHEYTYNEKEKHIRVKGVQINLSDDSISLEWTYSHENDVLAGVIERLITNVHSAYIKINKKDINQKLLDILKNTYEQVEVDNSDSSVFNIKNGCEEVLIKDGKVTGSNYLKNHVEKLLEKLKETI